MPIFNVGGTNYAYPNVGDKPWGTIHIAWAAAVSSLLTSVNTQVTNLVATQFTNPMLVNGDLITQIAGVPARLPIGANGQVLTLVSGLPAWSSVAGTGDVVGPAVSVDENLAVFDGVTGKLLKETTVNVSAAGNVTGVNNMSVGGAFVALAPDVATANKFRELSTRATGATVGVGGVAISGPVTATETTVTPQDIGAAAVITTSGRPVKVGLTAQAASSFVRLSMDSGSTSFAPFQGTIEFRRGATIISTMRFGFEYTNGAGLFIRDYPTSSFETIDVVAAGTYTYTCFIYLSSSSGTGEITVNDGYLVAYEL